jgi:outer membrane protein TolC
MDKAVRLTLVLLLAGLFGLSVSGCTRRFYRNRADLEVADILTDKDQFPEWQIEQYHVYPDPRARFADDTNPDRPPMPPDDPASAEMAPNPQKPGHAGVRMIEGSGYLELLTAWDNENRAEAAAATKQSDASDTDASSKKESTGDKEKPEEPKVLASGQTGDAISTALSPPPNAPRPYLLKLEQCVELGLINSREYQDARENLYMTALQVSLQRFSFAAQFFAFGQAVRQWSGTQTPTGHQNNWSLGSNVGVTKLFSTGALLLADFANQTVFNMSGFGRSLTSQSTINLDLIQPLLRGAGRAVTLEPLTLAERNLLYEIRLFARFRKEFYVSIAGGGAGFGGGTSGGGGSITGGSFQPVGVLAPGTFSPTAGLGSSGLVPGVPFPILITGDNPNRVNPGVSGQITLNTSLAAPIGGYLSTLLESEQKTLDEYSLRKLEENLRLAKAMAEGGDITELQVEQFEQQVLTRQTNLLSDQLQYWQSLDSFKLQLGLPTALPIELDPTPFRPLNQQFQRYEDLFNQFVDASEKPNALSTADASRVRGELRRIFTNSALVRGTRFRNQIEARWSAWEKLTVDGIQKRLEQTGEERRKLLATRDELLAKGQTLTPAQEQRLAELSFEIGLGTLERQLRQYEAQPWKKVANPDAQTRQQQLEFRYVVAVFIDVLIEPRNERLEQLRGTWPDLARLCVNGVDLLKSNLDESQAAVVQAALTNRLDLMNVKANLVDAWRQVAIFANALLGTLSVQYHMNTSTPFGLAEPLAFNAHRTQQQLILNTQLPLVRIQERNAYRACLINFQRARRILQGAEDRLASDTRNEARQLRQLAENYKIQQRQVELGYLAVENSLDTFKAPSQPGVAATAANAAALTNQLIQAQNSLYQAQFTMTTIWINYLNTRLQLYRDMELMPLDNRGVWIDDIATRECPGGAAGGNADRDLPCGTGPNPGGSQRPQPETLPAPQSTPAQQTH